MAATATATRPAQSSVEKPKRRQNPIIKGYLVLYNLACALGWLTTFVIAVTSLFEGAKNAVAFGIELPFKPIAPVELYERLTPCLHITQTLAVLEILHAITGVVPSAFLTTFLQVMSRIVVLWGFTYPTAYTHWSLYQLTISWAAVEVPRYLFYVWGLLFPGVQTPSLLFFLRYSLFAVLYPTGISAEILQLFQALPYWSAQGDIYLYIVYAILATYVPGSPFMYLHMVKMRKSQYKKRRAALQLQASTQVKKSQ